MMNYQTKAQELSFLSRDYAVAKDKENWLALFTKDALVQDPIGKSPLDPEGNGHKGIAAIEKFYDAVIANGDIEFTIIESISCADECANYAQIVNLVGDIKIETKMIVIYRINSNNKIESLRAFWDYQKMEKQLNELLSI
ncbi:nuclear transport factor 2 family protein [Gammaproteobacteria bacterium]|nr:nuclear transport factor 2 family protein [Gammaproteobacteria bacterium]